MSKSTSEIKLTAVIVLVTCILLFAGLIYLLGTDLDFFINQKSGDGKFRILKALNKEIEIEIYYYDEYQSVNIKKVKRIKNNYGTKLITIDSNNVIITYTKWFDQTFVENIKKPRILILVFEIIMLFLIGGGIKWSWKELQPS